VPQMRMRVLKYIPDKMYGFCRDDDSDLEVFFHLGSFRPGEPVVAARCPGCSGPPRCSITEDAPPPILGEPVMVDSELREPGGKAPRASRVERLRTPRMVVGVVESFDPQRRYGFVLGSDQVSYHLHESEVVDGRLPMTGRHLVFFPGLREGRPRACHVKVCR